MEELHESGKLGFTTLGLDDIDRVVIRIGVELHKDLTHQANARLTRNITQFQGVKLSNAALDQRRIAQAPRQETRRTDASQSLRAITDDPLAHDLIPAAVQLHRTAGHGLVRTHAKKHGLDRIADDEGLNCLVDVANSDLETGVVFQALNGKRNDWNLRISRIAQALTQQCGVVRCAAHSTRLRDADGGLIGICSTRHEFVNELTDDDDCGVAGVVVDVLQARFHGLTAGVLKDSNIEPRAPEQGLEEAEVDGRHLRGKNFVSRIAHFLGEDGPCFNVSGLDLLGFFARGNRSRVLVHRGVDRSRGHGSSLRNRSF